MDQKPHTWLTLLQPSSIGLGHLQSSQKTVATFDKTPKPQNPKNMKKFRLVGKLKLANFILTYAILKVTNIEYWKVISMSSQSKKKATENKLKKKKSDFVAFQLKV